MYQNGRAILTGFFSQAVTQQEALEEASMVVGYIKQYNISYPVSFDWESGKYQEYDGGPWIPYRVNNYGLGLFL